MGQTYLVTVGTFPLGREVKRGLGQKYFVTWGTRSLGDEVKRE